MHEAKFYKKISGTTLQCQLCNHFCAIKDGEKGFCRARENRGGKLYSLVYGYPVAINIDPVEKKPLFHFMPGSLSYSLGTLGCNFRCKNCQNWDISQEENISKKERSMEYFSPEKIVEEALGNECQSIAYTYNEPTIWTEYALDIMKLATKNNLKNIWVSNGFMADACLDAITPYLDAINIDIKSFDDEFYKENCAARLKPVLENCEKIKRKNIHLEITTLIIPTLSDDIEILKKIAEFIAVKLGDDTPWHISKFSPEISWRLRRLPATEEEVIYKAYEVGKEAGLKYIYAGNLPGDQKENTYCPNCGEIAIRRLGYEIERFDNNGRCPQCDKDLDIIE
jgi:pyruvate formate lyase activating enzyme